MYLITLGICLFIVLTVRLWDRVPEVGLLGQRVNACVILLDIAKPPLGAVPSRTFTSHE